MESGEGEIAEERLRAWADEALGARGRPTAGTRYGGSAEAMGARALGPLLLGFSLHLLRSAREGRLRTLHFLARDGDVMKAAFDRVAANVPGAPRSTYVLASRRAALVAATKAPDDVRARLRFGFGTARVHELFEDTLGLAPGAIDDTMLARHGLSRDTRIAPRHHARVTALVEDAMPKILAASARERDDYVGYLESVGFRAERGEAVVDIGYSGSMQIALDSLMGSKGELAGLYLVTIRGADGALRERGLSASGYLGESIDRLSREHAFFRHVALYETLFSNDATSLVRVASLDGRFVPELQREVPGERRRIEVVREVHRGALRFVDAAAAALGARAGASSIAPSRATREADSFFDAPDANDARIFAGVPFENAFGAATTAPLVPEEGAPAGAPAMWEAGRRAVLLDRQSRDASARPGLFARTLHAAASALLPRVLAPNKASKLRHEPSLFFADSRSAALRAIGRHYLRVV